MKRERKAAVSVLGLAISRITVKAFCPSILPIDNARQLSARGGLSNYLPRHQVPPVRCCRDDCISDIIFPDRLIHSCFHRQTNPWRLGAARCDANPREGGAERDEEGGSSEFNPEKRRSHPAAAAATADTVARARTAARCSMENGREINEKGLVMRRMRRRTRAKNKAIPAATNSQRDARRVRKRVRNVNMAESTATVTATATAPSLRSWIAGVRCVIVGKPLSFVRRKVDACRSFVASRERIHWISLAMAIYIAMSSLRPRLESLPVRTDGNYYGGPEDALPGLLQDEKSRPLHRLARSWRDRYRQRVGADAHRHGDGGRTNGVDTIATRLDDHAEELWRDSPAFRSAAAAATAAAAAAIVEDPLDPASVERANPRPLTDAAPSHEEGAREEAPLLAPVITGVPDPMSGGVAFEEDENAGEAPIDLHTHTDLRDLEVAAEKVLDSLPDKELIENGGGSAGGDRNQGNEIKESKAVVGDSAADRDADVSISAIDAVEETEMHGELRDTKAMLSPGPSTGECIDGAGTEEGEDDMPSVVPTREFSLLEGSASTSDKKQTRIFAETTTPEQMKSTLEAENKEGEEKEETSAGPSYAHAEKNSAATAFDADVEETTTPTLPNPTVLRPARIPGPDGIPRPGNSGGVGDRSRHSTSFVAVAARAVSPAVCRIDMERLVGTGQDVPFPGVEVGQGSGVIFSSEDGLVLTNAHVVAGARKVTVTLTDGRKFLAEVKGSDELSDLAVLKIDRGVGAGDIPLPAATLGDSQDLQVGDWVIAVGNPVGLDSTVTLGIVSSMKRSSEEVGFPERKVTFIQTDAAINPGNSGGPLVNEFGEVVGINTAIRAHTEGIGFAIPINKAKAIMHDLAEGNRIEYAYIGIHMTTITPDFAIQNNRDPNSHQLIPEVNGAIIMRVLPDTPAFEAGLRRHDVVIEMRDRTVRTADDAKQIVDESRVGDVLAVKVLRGLDRVVELEVKTRDMSEQLGVNAVKPRQTPGYYGDGGGVDPLRTPRSQPRHFPGVSPPSFPWGSSQTPPANENSPARSSRRPQQESELREREEDFREGLAMTEATPSAASFLDEDPATLPLDSGGRRELEG